jgi:hypothetical protein
MGENTVGCKKIVANNVLQISMRPFSCPTDGILFSKCYADLLGFAGLL